MNKHPSRVAKLWCSLQVYTYQISNTHTNSGTVYIHSFKGNVKSQLEKFHESKVWATWPPLPTWPTWPTWPSPFCNASSSLAPFGCPTCPNPCLASPKHFKLKMFQTHFFTFPSITTSVFPLQVPLEAALYSHPPRIPALSSFLRIWPVFQGCGLLLCPCLKLSLPHPSCRLPQQVPFTCSLCKRGLLLLSLIHILHPLPTWQMDPPSTQTSPSFLLPTELLWNLPLHSYLLSLPSHTFSAWETGILTAPQTRFCFSISEHWHMLFLCLQCHHCNAACWNSTLSLKSTSNASGNGPPLLAPLQPDAWLFWTLVALWFFYCLMEPIFFWLTFNSIPFHAHLASTY